MYAEEYEVKFKALQDAFHAELFELYSSIQKLYIFLLSVSVVTRDNNEVQGSSPDD